MRTVPTIIFINCDLRRPFTIHAIPAAIITAPITNPKPGAGRRPGMLKKTSLIRPGFIEAKGKTAADRLKINMPGKVI